jgi:hypothetical protein
MTGTRREVGFDRVMEPKVTVVDGSYGLDGAAALENGSIPAPRV